MNQVKEIDNKLLRQVLKGDKKSEKEFIDLCMGFIWGSLQRFDQLSYEDKQDLQSQIVYKQIFGELGDWVGIRKFKAQSKFTTYLYGIITFRALDFLKSKGIKYRSKTVSVDSQLNISNSSIDPNDLLTIDSSLAILKPKQRKIMELSAEGYTHKEIAKKLDTTTNNISSTISRAQKKMKKYNKMQEKQE